MELHHYFYRINQVFLVATGCWPHQRKIEKIILRSIFFAIDLGNLPPLIAYFFSKWGDFDAIACATLVTASYLLGITKISNVIIQDKKIQNLFEQIRHDWKVWSSEPQIKFLEKFAEKGRNLNFIYTAAVCASASSYTIVTVIPQIYHLFVPQINGTRESYLLPQDYGVDNEEYFYWIYTYNLLGVYVNSTIYVTADAIYLTFVHHTCGILAAVGDRFESIVVNYCKTGKQNHRLMIRNDIYFCVEQYDSALKFASKLNDIYSVYFFIIIGVNTTNLIFSASQTVGNSNKLDDTVKYGQYGLLMVCLLFLNSFPAQRLIDCSSNVSLNIYNSCWYEMPVSLRKSLLFILMRTSKMCTIKIGKFFTLSLQTFSSVVRVTVSVCTMLLSIR